MTLDEMRIALGREEPIAFTPVPRVRRRRNGWDDRTQADFIAALSLCGSVRAAAEAVGRSPRSAYKLLDAPGADDFARAWDEALDIGLTETRTRSLQRALFGELVPVFRNGVMTGLRHKRADRLAIAVLSGRGVDDSMRRTAVIRRAQHAEWKAADQAREIRARTAAEREARAAERRADPPPPPRIPRVPRIRCL